MLISKKEEDIQTLLVHAYSLRVSNLNESIKLTNKALKLSENLLNSELAAQSLSKLGLYFMVKGNYILSNDFSNRAIRYFETIGNERGIADAKFNIASTHYKSDNFQLGLLNLIDCLEIYKKHADYLNIGKVYKSMGTVYEFLGDQKNAIHSYNETIVNAKIVGDKNLESNAYNPLSGIYLKQNEIKKALELANLAMDMKLDSGDERGYAFSTYARAKVYAYLGKYKEAESDYLTALKIHIEGTELLGSAMVYRKLGELYILSHQNDLAIKTLLIAKEFSYKHQIGIIKYKTNLLLYQLYKKLDKTSEALSYLEEYNITKEQVINNQTISIIENHKLLDKLNSVKREAELQKEKAEMIAKKNEAENLANLKQDFLSTMSHEIRTPLNAVITIANLLQSNSNEEEVKLVKSLKYAANNLLLLINDILDFTKLDSGKMALEKQPFDIKKLFYDIQQMYIGLATEKGLAISLKFDSKLKDFYELDETRISQIMANLIGNAIKYTSNGEIKIELYILSSKQNSDKIRISVEDTGIGIETNKIQEIFDSFSQIQNVRTRKHGGSGLGLAIVKKLVNLHNSEIQVISTIGKGSIFYFDIAFQKSDFITKNESVKEKV
jgi:hypothetical protein